MKNNNNNSNCGTTNVLESVGELGKTACSLTAVAAFSAGVGFIAGLFCAPKAGKDLRKDLKEQSTQFIDRAKEQSSHLIDRAKEQINHFTHKNHSEDYMSTAGRI